MERLKTPYDITLQHFPVSNLRPKLSLQRFSFVANLQDVETEDGLLTVLSERGGPAQTDRHTTTDVQL